MGAVKVKVPNFGIMIALPIRSYLDRYDPGLFKRFKQEITESGPAIFQKFVFDLAL
jgi:hypothetical protein